MKKVASLVAAGALLISVSGVVLAGGMPPQIGGPDTKVIVTTTSSSSTGGLQIGSGKQVMFTGDSVSMATSFVGANINIGGKRGSNQETLTVVKTDSESSTGGKQLPGKSEPPKFTFGPFGGSTPSSQFMVTGDSGSSAKSIVISNVSFSFGR
jgi:hypothetical protein